MAEADQPKRPRKWRRRLGCLALLLLAAFVVACAVTSWTSGIPQSNPHVATGTAPAPQPPSPTFRVMTLNLAHGRGTSFHQWLLDTETIEANLTKAAATITQAGAELIALQEADRPSRWSGKFDHVDFVADAAKRKFRVGGAHVSGLGLSYGTALISQHRMDDGLSVTFAPSPPTFSKGFVAATVDVPAPNGTRPVRFVSVHLDFAFAKVRRRQVEELIRWLRDAKPPVIVCGDFNCTWTDQDSPVRHLAETLQLHAHEPESGDATFPTLDRRLDWILVSRELVFDSYEVLKDADVSDHYPVSAQLRWRK